MRAVTQRRQPGILIDDGQRRHRQAVTHAGKKAVAKRKFPTWLAVRCAKVRLDKTKIAIRLQQQYAAVIGGRRGGHRPARQRKRRFRLGIAQREKAPRALRVDTPAPIAFDAKRNGGLGGKRRMAQPWLHGRRGEQRHHHPQQPDEQQHHDQQHANAAGTDNARGQPIDKTPGAVAVVNGDMIVNHRACGFLFDEAAMLPVAY